MSLTILILKASLLSDSSLITKPSNLNRLAEYMAYIDPQLTQIRLYKKETRELYPRENIYSNNVYEVFR